MRSLFTTLIVLLTCTSFGQEIEKPKEKIEREEFSTGRLSLNISPLSILDIYGGSTYKAGLQFRPFKNIAVGADAGAYLKGITEAITIYYNITGYHARFRLGFYPEKLPNLSFGLEYQFKRQTLSYTDSTETIPSFQADLHKRVHGYNIYAAFDHNFTERLFLDIQLGVGLRYKDLNNTGSYVVEDGTSLVWPWDSLHGGRVTTGKGFKPHLSFNVRLGYAIFKNK